MSHNQTNEYSRYWVKRYIADGNIGNQMQQAIQEYIKRYKQMPFLVLVPQGLHLLSPISNFEVKQDERVPPYRFYFALREDET